MEEEIVEEPKKKKVKFDAKNPQHASRAAEVLKKSGGNRDKAALVFAKEFD